MKTIRTAVVGLGSRGASLYDGVIKNRADVETVAVCDVYADRCRAVADCAEAAGKKRPVEYTDYRRCIDESKPDAVIVATSWDEHIPVSIYCMERGIAVGCEVGGAYSLQALWDLVRCYERTGTPIMLLENCCYGRLELLALQMKRLGLLGEIVHCEGGYRHDLRSEVCFGKENRHYRLEQYRHRNCENYPTHEIGPIAEVLDINRGNRFLTLTSTASPSKGLRAFAAAHKPELADVSFNQADVVTTVIQCQNGETVTVTLETGLPRYYSRGFAVHGTKGLVCEENRSVYLESEWKGEIWDWSKEFGNVDRYYARYDHPLWKDYHPDAAGHGGIDALVLDAFFTAVKKGEPMPIDVYDMATWMSIGVLSEQSIATKQTVYFPDFTDGKWITRKPTFLL